MAKALFLDRDGTINVDHGYVHSPEQFEFIDGIFDFCRKAQACGYLIIIITNQSGIARGYYAESDYQKLTQWMVGEFEKQGVCITDVLHSPDLSGPDRKPEPGLFLKAQKKWNINMSASLSLGDKPRDVEAGERAGVGTNILFVGSYDDIPLSPLRISIAPRNGTKVIPGFIYDGAEFAGTIEGESYDWRVVYDEMLRHDAGAYKNGCEKLMCSRERTMLLTSEPTSIKRYSSAYTHQFGHLLTNRPPEADKHSHYHFGEGYYHWCYDKMYNEVVKCVLPPKTKILSVVCSAKQMAHTAHRARFTLIKNIAEAIPECDWYGYGVKPLTKKYEALDEYKYSLAIENHIAPGHWSEKIADVLLAEALPFYAGDPNLEKVLPPESFIRIPIDNPSEAIRIVKEAIANNEYEKRLPAIRAAKHLLLTKYNMWAQILKVIREVEHQPVTPVNPERPWYLKSRRALRRNPLVALSDGWYHLCEELQRLWH